MKDITADAPLRATMTAGGHRAWLPGTGTHETALRPGRSLLAAALVAALALVPLAAAQAVSLDRAAIEKSTGLTGTYDEKENVFKVSYPRQDIEARVAGTHLTPELGLTAWTAFTPAGDHVMVMGDIVLLENEVGRVMSAALDAGLQVTALHDHFLWDTPRVMYMHIAGTGSQQAMAEAVGRVYRTLKEVIHTPPAAPAADIDPATGSLDGEAVARVIGTKGTLSKGVYKIVIGRHATMGGHEMGKAMGVNTWAAFAGSDQKAIVDGDFAMHEGEVQGVLKALRGANINVVAIHNHMVGESPRYVFLHYWGIGPARELATGIRRALDETAAR